MDQIPPGGKAYRSADHNNVIWPEGGIQRTASMLVKPTKDRKRGRQSKLQSDPWKVRDLNTFSQGIQRAILLSETVSWFNRPRANTRGVNPDNLTTATPTDHLSRVHHLWESALRPPRIQTSATTFAMTIGTNEWKRW